jgi:hypothetical protein
VADEDKTATAFVPSAPIGETTEPDSPSIGITPPAASANNPSPTARWKPANVVAVGSLHGRPPLAAEQMPRSGSSAPLSASNSVVYYEVDGLAIVEGDQRGAGGIALEHVEQLSVQHCLMPCPACAALGIRSGCNREKGHVGVHHCSNYNQGPHEWQ